MGDPAPRFELRGIDNQIRSLDEADGPTGTFLFFYSRELKDCRAAFPYMERLTRLVVKRGGRVWAVTRDGHGESLETADQFQLSFPILLDRRGWVSQAYAVAALPSFFHLDGELRLVQSVLGWKPDDVRTAALAFAQTHGMETDGLFQEGDWLPGA
jgi:peroxiredoxin